MLSMEEFTSELSHAFVGTGRWYASQTHSHFHTGLAWLAFREDPQRFSVPTANNPLGNPIIGLLSTPGNWWLPIEEPLLCSRLLSPVLSDIYPSLSLCVAGTSISGGTHIGWNITKNREGSPVVQDGTLMTANSFYALVMLSRWLQYHMNVSWDIHAFLADMTADERQSPLLANGFPRIELKAEYRPAISLVETSGPDHTVSTWHVSIDQQHYPIGASAPRDTVRGRHLASCFLVDVAFAQSQDTMATDHDGVLGRYRAIDYSDAGWHTVSDLVATHFGRLSPID